MLIVDQLQMTVDEILAEGEAPDGDHRGSALSCRNAMPSRLPPRRGALMPPSRSD
jgi:hypothetical protein